MQLDPPLKSTTEENKFNHALRPKNLTEFVGHQEVVERLKIFIQASKERKEPLGHTLLYGPAGLGKTSLAHIIKEELGVNMVITSGPLLEKAKDLAGILTSLEEGDILFIDEIHRLSRVVEEYLYPALENFSLDILLDSGPSARSINIQLHKFTLVGATTRFGDLTSPLRSRFQLISRLDYYSLEDLSHVVCFSAKKLEIMLPLNLGRLIAERSRGTPRLANNLLRWLRDYITVCNQGVWTEASVKAGLVKLGIDLYGLDSFDRRLLEIIYVQHNGGPVGVSNLAASLGEEIATIEEVLEPHLIALGLLRRTHRGRELTPKGLEHIQKIKTRGV
ncbi:MAG: Holliday junction branch migration DNA helicase RuvB [Chlamydiae bacterium]|nr:Holliday junction branch migration DNA helicase RuvB [Chlamydiota bacterium]